MRRIYSRGLVDDMESDGKPYPILSYKGLFSNDWLHHEDCPHALVTEVDLKCSPSADLTT